MPISLTEVIEPEAGASPRERKMTILLFAAVGLLTFSDLLEDRAEGADWGHLFVEATIMLLCFTGAGYLWRRTIQLHRSSTNRLASEVVAAREDAARWRREASSYLLGLGQAIEQQFNSWGLTAAEKEIGLLLLKGLSHKEIAVVRETSERTVRQQAAAVYRKSLLDGRAQLSAFFLEDLLLPSDEAPSLSQNRQTIEN